MQFLDIWCLWLSGRAGWKNCGVYLHMYENAEDLTSVCTICWEANSSGNNFFFQNDMLYALQEADVYSAKGSWYSLTGRCLLLGGLWVSGCAILLLDRVHCPEATENAPSNSEALVHMVWVKPSSDILGKAVTASPLSHRNCISC